MIHVIFIADFELSKTGIISTATNILSHFDTNDFDIYSNINITVIEKESKELKEVSLDRNDRVIIFTHFECSHLPKLVKLYPMALVHVGDWPGNYWNSLIAGDELIKGILGTLRFFYRSFFIPKETKLIFVSHTDTLSALNYGYKYSNTIEIGVVIPTNEINSNIDCNTLVFTGNFRYEPNRLAANQLIQYSTVNDHLNFALVGYYADELIIGENKNIKCYPNVESIPNFLNENRYIYVSPVKVGAGAKNKILEAIVSGCPIIATRESLDPSINMIESIFIIDELSEVEAILNKIENNIEYTKNITDDMKNLIIETRSWQTISKKMRVLIDET
jgi:glycosyltransferase involved in cell wall biosynthesis